MKEKRLRKSNDRKLCGVCGGIAEYFGIDPTLVRLVFVIMLFVSGIGVLPYIIAAVIMDEPEGYIENRRYIDQDSYSANNNYESGEPVGFKPDSDDSEIKGFNV